MKISVLIILGFLFLGCREPLSNSHWSGDKSMPAFDCQLLDSITSIKSSEFKKDKPIILFIFDPECMYCKGLLQSIVDNINDFNSINIYMISYAKVGRLKEYSSSMKLEKYSNIVIGRDKSGSTLKYFELTNVPFIAIYDRDHKFKAAFQGMTSPDTLLNSALN